MTPGDDDHRKKSSVARRGVALVVSLLLLAAVLLFFLTPKQISRFAEQISGQQSSNEEGPLTLLDSGIISLKEDGQVRSINLEPYMREVAKKVFVEEQEKASEKEKEEEQAATGEEEAVVEPGEEAEPNTDEQILSLNGNVLAISGGNAVTLPTQQEQDSVVGNEITDTVSGGGLLRVGAGTTLDPYAIRLQTCVNGEVLKSGGAGTWSCAADVGGVSYTAGNGLQLVGSEFAVSSPTCSGTDKLQWNGTAFVCSADVDTNTTYTAGTGLSLVGTSFSNTGLLSLTASGALTSTGGQNPDIAFASGTASGQFWQWNGTAWALAALPADNGVTAVGALDGQTKTANGAAVSGNTLYLQSADATNPGLVTIGAQTFAGTKTYQGAIIANGNLGVGAAVPNNKLEVNSAVAGSSGIRLTQVTAASTAGAGNGKVLSVDANGDIVLVSDINGTQTVTMQNAYDNGNIITTSSGTRDVTIQAGSGASSTSTFEVLNILGDQMFSVDTTNGRVVIGHDPAFQGARAKLYFGDMGTPNNLWIGEQGGTDTDILQMQGKNGLRLTTGSSAFTALSIGGDGSFLSQNNTDSGAGFAIADAAGKYMFSVDTTAKEVHIGEVSPGGNLAGVRLVMGDTGCIASTHSCISLSEEADDVLRVHSESGMMFSSNNGTARLWIDANNTTEVGVNTTAPTNTLDVNGTLRVRSFGAATATTVCRDVNGVLASCSSSQRYKTNIDDLGYGLETLEAMRPVGFNWINTGERDIGFIAEEMAKIVPEVITYRDGQIEGINYSALTAVLASAIQEQQLQINELRQATWDGGIVAKSTTFNDFVAFNSGVEFNGMATFNDDVYFNDNVTFAGNMAGSVELTPGQSSARVDFSRPHETPPVVTATPQDFLQGSYRIKDVTTDSFVIELSQPQPGAAGFNWTAVRTQ